MPRSTPRTRRPEGLTSGRRYEVITGTGRKQSLTFLRTAAGLLAGLLAALALASCGGDSGQDVTEEPPAEAPASQTPAPAQSQAAEEVIAKGLEAPWSIAFHERTPLISERDSGRILELDESGETREIASIEGVTPMGEGGLLGIAVHDGYLYAYFTAGDENRIERFELSGKPGGLQLGPAEPVLGGLPAGAIHNGGRIAFGPDGMLYATVGDTGDADTAQNRGSLGGKILRLTPEGEVPADNPFKGSPVYSYGHRNPQGIAWRGETMYASEFGQDTWDELNVIEPGRNYGWPEVEGKGGGEGFTDPVQQWSPAEASPSGIAIAGGSIYIANLRGERLRVVPIGDTSKASERFVGKYGRIRDAVRSPDGEVWLLTNNTDGRGSPSPGDDRILRIPAE